LLLKLRGLLPEVLHMKQSVIPAPLQTAPLQSAGHDTIAIGASPPDHVFPVLVKHPGQAPVLLVARPHFFSDDWIQNITTEAHTVLLVQPFAT
jgi:hypothetical protein